MEYSNSSIIQSNHVDARASQRTYRQGFDCHILQKSVPILQNGQEGIHESFSSICLVQ
jgi:hypothetical protein